MILKPPTTCVLCDRLATTTAAQIPVCSDHDRQYQEEAQQYLKYRPFYLRLQRAHAQREGNKTLADVAALQMRIAELEAEVEKLSQYRSLVTAGGGK